MSYCRWSSYGWKCDVYVYEDVNGGWTTHVASRRRVAPEPCPEIDWDQVWHMPQDKQVEAVERWRNAEREWLDRAEVVDIGLEFDGQSFNDPTAAECAETLRMLKGAGYWVPDDVISELEQEAA
jgi:hypothetical protein